MRELFVSHAWRPNEREGVRAPSLDSSQSVDLFRSNHEQAGKTSWEHRARRCYRSRTDAPSESAVGGYSTTRSPGRSPSDMAAAWPERRAGTDGHRVRREHVNDHLKVIRVTYLDECALAETVASLSCMTRRIRPLTGAVISQSSPGSGWS